MKSRPRSNEPNVSLDDMFIDMDDLSLLLAVKTKQMRTILKKMLAQLGIGKTVHVAESGLEALNLLQTTPVDLLLFDRDMAGDNRETLARSLQQDFRLKHLPMVILDPDSDAEGLERPSVGPAQACLAPPLVPAVLDETIRTIVHAYNCPDEAARLARRASEYESREKLRAAVRYLKIAVRLKPGDRFMAGELARVSARAAGDGAVGADETGLEDDTCRLPGDGEQPLFIEIDDMSVLVVDSTKNMRTVIKKMLKTLGLGQKFHFAENGSLALQLMKKIRVDFVVSSWQMPVMNGKQLISAMGQNKKLRDIPVLILTADPEEEIAAKASRTLSSDSLAKPLAPLKLEAKIRAAVLAVNYPDEAACLARKAWDYADEENLNAAIRYLRIALRLKPDDVALKHCLSRFYIRAGQPDQAKALEQDAPAAVQSPGPVPVFRQAGFIEIENMSVLIVDDMKNTRTIIKKTMKNLGLGKTFHYAADGAEALEILKSRHMDIVISDWQMPVMDGEALLSAMKKDKKLRDIPVVLLTANSEKKMRMDVAETQADAYLTKPAKPLALEEKIRSVVENFNYPDEASVLIRKARDYEENGEFKSAIRYLQTAIRVKPGDSRLVRKLSQMYTRAGHVAKAQETLLKTIEVDPMDAVSHFMISRQYWEQEEWEESVLAGIKTLGLTNRFDPELIACGEELLDRGENRLAVQLLERIINKTGKGLALKKRILALCIKKKELEYAKALVGNLVKEYPSDTDLFFSAGLVYEAVDDWDKAVEYFLLADEHFVKPVETKFRLARIFSWQQDYERADHLLARIFDLEPDHDDALRLQRSISYSTGHRTGGE